MLQPPGKLLASREEAAEGSWAPTALDYNSLFNNPIN